MSAMDQQLYQQLILEHNRKPRNFKKIEFPTHFAQGFNPLCGDRYEVYLTIDDSGIVKDVGFEGHGCAISKASASLMTETVKGKSMADASKIFQDFRELLKGEQSATNQLEERLGKLKIFSGIWKYPARVKCAALSWHALQAAFDNKEQISTE